MSVRAPAMRTDLDGGARAMARGAAVNLAGAGAQNILAFVLLFVTTHVVSVRGIGLLTVGTTVVTLTLVPALLGLDTGVVRFVAKAAAVKDEEGARGALQCALFLAAVASALLTAVILWKAPSLAGLIHRPGSAAAASSYRSSVDQTVELIRLSALALPGLAIGRIALAASQGFGVMTYSAWFGSLRICVNLVAAVGLLAVGFGVRGLAMATSITAWVTCAAALAVLLRVHDQAFRIATRRWHARAMLRFSFPQTLSAMLFFTILWTDTLLLARLRGPEDVGVYAVVCRLLVPATLISTSIGQMFSPRIVAADVLGEHDHLAQMLKRVTYWNTAVSLPFFALLVVIPGPLLGLFGSRYEAGAEALAILAVGQLINTAAGPLGQVISMSGRPYISMLNNALVAGLNIAGCAFLIPRYGLVGAACSTAGSLTLVNLIKEVEIWVLLRVSPFRSDSLLAFLAAGGAIAMTLPVALIPDWPPGPYEALACCVTLFAGYTWLVLTCALRGEERAAFERGRSRIARFRHT